MSTEYRSELAAKAELKFREFENLAKDILRDCSTEEAREFLQLIESGTNDFLAKKGLQRHISLL